MHARIDRIPNNLISLSLIALLAAALVADQARANLHREIRASSAFHTSTEEHSDSTVLTAAWCRSHRGAIDTDPGAMNLTRSADGEAADAPTIHR